MSEALKPEITVRIKQLEEKFKNSGQDLGSYLDGLLYDRYITYWDYIHLDTLLSLQVPSTHFPDEEIFITYHQITELYFKLILHEMKQIVQADLLEGDFFLEKISRINRYFKVLIDSFEVMEKGMDKEQFLKFRMSLIPASGFQSVQFRMIEIYATPLCNLVNEKHRNNYNEESSIEDAYEQLYWKYGATDVTTGEKTLTLRQFEKRYAPRLLRIANQLKDSTIYDCYNKVPNKIRERADFIDEMRKFDVNVNVNWGLAHYKTAFKYLSKKGKTVKATGGTNWKQFLPPTFQKLSFFPSLWTEEERLNWGKAWVEEFVNSDK
mgnify:CR=1 FL=1